MNKKRIIYVLMVLILLLIGITIFIVFTNKKTDKINIENTENDENYEKWYYKDIKIENDPDNIVDADISLSYIVIKEKYVDVCYQFGCYPAKYTIANDTISIEEGNYFSGEFKISYENEYLYLEQNFARGYKIIYTFEKEDN